MPTEKEFAELKVLVERIAASPKVKPYIDGSVWPRPMGLAEGTTSSGASERVAFDAEHPKSKDVIAAEAAEGAAQQVYDAASNAWLRASNPNTGGVWMHTDGYGNNVIVDRSEEVANSDLLNGRTDIPEYAAKRDAEGVLIKARVRLIKLQKKRDEEFNAWERKRNPILNPSKSEPGLISRITRIR
jgi:hypothetical protein